MSKSTAPSRRELSVDAYRVCAVLLIVAGHWLAASLAYRDGHFIRENALADLPWTQWLTWIFQVVPVFFVVAGYAGAASWTRRTTPRLQDWLGHRLRATLGPTTAYVLTVMAVVATLRLVGVDSNSLALSGWAVAMHLWFIPVYLVLVSLTPLAVAAHHRWGLWAPSALAISVVVVDVVSLSGWLPQLGLLNNLLCWATTFQIGVAWFFGALGGPRAATLAALSAAVAALALAFGPYPVSLIGVPGQVVQNSSPPSVVMLALGCAQAGVLIALAPQVSRWLERSKMQRALGSANRRVMPLYLWHMVAVVLLTIVAYPTGLFPQPELGSADWWWSRLLWVVSLSVLTGGVLLLVGRARRLFAAGLGSVPVGLPVSWANPLLLAGAGAAAVALWQISLRGFAPDGEIPWTTALLYVGGIAVAALHPQRTLSEPTSSMKA